MNIVQHYRQPMVTATGIFLGFLLNFTGQWFPNALTSRWYREAVYTVCLVVSIASLMLVLYRMLKPHDQSESDKFYRRTLRLFLIGVSLPFAIFLEAVIEKLVITMP